MSDKKVPMTERTLDQTAPEVIPYLRPHMDVLDVGCGPGVITMDIAEIVNPGTVYGIDPDVDRTKKAKEISGTRNITNADFSTMDAHELSFEDDTFDMALSTTALHAFREPIRALREQKRVAKKGGWVLAAI